MTDNFDFSAQPEIARDQIYVSWTEVWPLSRYVEDWLKTRKLRTDDAAREIVTSTIARYPWVGPLRKPDVDYYLENRITRSELELPRSMQKAKRK